MGMKQCQARTQITGWLKCEGCLFLLFLIGVEGNLGMRSSKFLHLTLRHILFPVFSSLRLLAGWYLVWGLFLGHGWKPPKSFVLDWDRKYPLASLWDDLLSDFEEKTGLSLESIICLVLQYSYILKKETREERLWFIIVKQSLNSSLTVSYPVWFPLYLYSVTLTLFCIYL